MDVHSKKMYFCRTFEAIHNKDYSVVKTSKTGAHALVFFLPFIPFFTLLLFFLL